MADLIDRPFESKNSFLKIYASITGENIMKYNIILFINSC